MFGRGWNDAEATIVERRLVSQDTHVGGVVGQTVKVYEYIAEVRPVDGSEPFRAVMQEPFNAIHFKAPMAGQVVRVKYNHAERGEHKVKFDRDDRGTYEDLPGQADKKAVRAAHSAEAQAAWDATLNAPPDSAPNSSGGPASASGRSAAGGQRGDQPDPQVRRARVAVREARRRGDTAEVERLTTELEQLEHGSTHARSRNIPGAESIEQRLAKLQQLRDDGVLTPEEYTAQRQRILDSL